MTTITALPPAPSRTDPATFSDKSDALLGALDTFVTETNTVAGECVANAASAAAQVSLAAEQVSLAAGQVALATAQADAAAISATAASGSALVAGATAWVSGTTYAIGDARYSPINLQTYRRKTNGGGTTDPSADSTNWAKAVEVGISNIVTATSMTTLTSTPTLLQITPANYGVTVKLPDATTCSVGGPIHIIDNRGGYSIRVENSAGTLLGFVYGGVASDISLNNNSTSAGVWSVGSSELSGISAQTYMASTALLDVTNTIDLGNGREILVGSIPSSGHCYAVVYDKTSNAFGSLTVIRATNVESDLKAACLVDVDKVLVVSCTSASTAFEAVVLSISGTTITVGTAATATLSANISSFGYDYGVMPCNGSFVCGYAVATPAIQLRALTVSGTTVTIGSATALDGTSGGAYYCSVVPTASGVIAASVATTHLYTKYYGISGTTITTGTGTDTNSGTMTLRTIFPLGSYWAVLFNDGGSTPKCGIISLSGTATSISIATAFSAGAILDAIVIGSDKVLITNNQTSNNVNLITNTAGTASAGTAITASAGTTTRSFLYASGTDAAMVVYNSTAISVLFIDCSGSSPVLSKWVNPNITTADAPIYGDSGSRLSKNANHLYGAKFAESYSATNTHTMRLRIYDGTVSLLLKTLAITSGYKGKSSSERWIISSSCPGMLTKLECVA